MKSKKFNIDDYRIDPSKIVNYKMETEADIAEEVRLDCLFNADKVSSTCETCGDVIPQFMLRKHQKPEHCMRCDRCVDQNPEPFLVCEIIDPTEQVWSVTAYQLRWAAKA